MALIRVLSRLALIFVTVALVAFGTYLSHRLVAANSPHQSSGGHQ